MEVKKNFMFPIPVLQPIVQYGDNILREFYEKYWQQMIQTYLAHKQAMDENFQKWLQMGLDYSTMAQKTMAGLTPY
jgi:hypothetical protein